MSRSSSFQSNPTHNCPSDWREIIELCIFISEIVNVCGALISIEKVICKPLRLLLCEGKLAKEAM